MPVVLRRMLSLVVVTIVGITGVLRSVVMVVALNGLRVTARRRTGRSVAISEAIRIRQKGFVKLFRLAGKLPITDQSMHYTVVVG